MNTIHEFGKEKPDVLLMFPPLGCRSDIYDYVRPALEKQFCVMIVSYPGLDEEQPRTDFIPGTRTSSISSAMSASMPRYLVSEA